MSVRDELRYERALAILHRMATERTGWRSWLFGRWYYADEPLRNDAGNLIREVQFSIMQPHHTRLINQEDAP